MEVGDMHFNFDPAEQDVWVQHERFPATPAMVAFVNMAAAIGFTVFGLTGRNDNQKAATLANLAKDGYKPFVKAGSTPNGPTSVRRFSRLTSAVRQSVARPSNTRPERARTSSASGTRSSRT
jgi:hypothetical protein